MFFKIDVLQNLANFTGKHLLRDNGFLGQGKTYYVNLDISNKDPRENVTLIWVENGESKETTLTPYGSASYQSQFLSTTDPGTIQIQAKTSSGKPALINGRQVFDMQPRIDTDTVNLEIIPAVVEPGW